MLIILFQKASRGSLLLKHRHLHCRHVSLS